jgi:hypothetical protein
VLLRESLAITAAAFAVAAIAVIIVRRRRPE